MIMDSFFDENGYLNFDDAVMNVESFKKIMEDGVVTDQELAEQSRKVADLFRKLEQTCSKEQIGLIKDAFCEIGVLFAVYNYKELQSIR